MWKNISINKTIVMKIKLLFFCAMLIHCITFSQNIDIPDNNFKSYLLNNSEINTNDDDEIQVSEATSFTGEIAIAYSAISSLTGLEEFINITSLSLFSCSLNSINISSNTSLQKLDVSKNNLTVLDISEQKELLEELTFSENNIISMDVSLHTNLTKFVGAENELTGLDLSTNTLLVTVDVSDNEIEGSLNLNSENLVTMRANNNKLTSVDLNKASGLQFLGVKQNLLTALDLSNNKIVSQVDCARNKIENSLQLDSSNLYSLDCSYNELTTLDTSAALGTLKLVNCSDNNLTTLDFTSNTDLVQIDCEWNELTSLLVDGLDTWLQVINCHRNNLTSLNLDDNSNLRIINISYNNLNSLDVSNNPLLNNLFCSNNNLTALNLTNNPNLNHLDAPYNNLMTVDARNDNNTKMTSASKFRLSNNTNLQCVFVDNITYSIDTWTQIDPSGTFVIDEAACQALSVNSFSTVNVSLFPNPVKNSLEVTTNAQIKKVTFYNILGKKIKTSTSAKINVSDLKIGVYILEIDLKNDTKVIKKIVKQF
jgi:Leucine-rich repeat (LRR) protein